MYSIFISYNSLFTDGGWSDWVPWGQCSSSSVIGLKSRHRQCDNPLPSILGQSCLGSSQEWEICNMLPR